MGRELPSGQVSSKVGTKTAAFKNSVDLELVKGFGEYYCTEEMAMNAEKFLLQILEERDFTTFD